MKFVILSHKLIPGFGVKGPIMSPATYDIHLILKWVAVGIDVREVMEDGSLRRLKVNDPRLLEELNKKLERKAAEREALKKAKEEVKVRVTGNVRLIPEARPLPKKKPKVRREEIKKEEPKVEEKVQEVKEEQDLFIDQLEKPE